MGILNGQKRAESKRSGATHIGYHDDSPEVRSATNC